MTETTDTTAELKEAAESLADVIRAHPLGWAAIRMEKSFAQTFSEVSPEEQRRIAMVCGVLAMINAVTEDARAGTNERVKAIKAEAERYVGGAPWEMDKH